MPAEPLLPALLPLVALLPLGLAAAQDVACRTIPDGASVAVVLIGLAARASEGGATLLVAGGTALAVFAACLLLWWRGLLGGGDAKLLPATALLVPPLAVPGLLLDVALAGGMLALLYLLAARRAAALPLRPRGGLAARVCAVESRRLRRGGPLPYGVAIAVGAALAMTGQGA